MPHRWKNSTNEDRLTYIMEQMDWTEAELARQMGTSQSGVQNWLSGRNKTISPRFVWPLQDKWRWNARWVLEGEGLPRIEPVEREKQAILDEIKALPLDRLKAIKSLVNP